ncbi:hypothetical protein KAT51_03725 [bacterium]|nr:hypothetical protein [bacterium]
MFTTKVILMVVGSYLLGSLLWAYIIAKMVRGIDIQGLWEPRRGNDIPHYGEEMGFSGRFFRCG